jgi:hypothetical protein
MSSPDNVARLREIKRLLDRIQQLPHIAGIPNGGLPNVGIPNGLIADDGIPNGLMNGTAGPPHPAAALDPEVASDPLGLRLDPPPLDLSRRDTALRDQSRALVPVQPAVRGGVSPWVFVLATAANAAVAAVLAVVITLNVARHNGAPSEADKLAAGAATKAMAEKPAVPAGEPALQRGVQLLPVGSREAPLQLEASKPARLPLQVRPEEAMEDGYILLLTGLPAKANLSGVSAMGTDSWLVSPGALRRIEIVVPEWSASVVEVAMELRRTNGAILSQSKMWLAVPPPPVAAGTKLDETALNELVRGGDRQLKRGDVPAARALYERAAAMGSAQAAFALGTTYDPRRLWSLGVFGMVGNKERARHWYERAHQLGHPDARARISALQ